MNLVIRNMTKEDLDAMMAEHKRLNPDLPIREDIKLALYNYAEKGWGLGGFLTAVVENDLFEAMGKADSYNRATIHQICSYVYNELPGECWGSPETVKKWRAGFKPKESND